MNSDPVQETPSSPDQHLGETEFQAVRGDKFHALFPLVGIGASAGGLSALKTLFSKIPEASGMAYVVVVHLSPEHKSHLAELLQPHVKMPVQQVSGTVKLEPNQVYVIPPNANLDTIDTHLRLSQLEASRRERAPIDHFFRTLANTHGGRAIGVILTGTGSDGTLGIRQIKEAGGLTIVQDPNDAEYDGMPQSAISTGLIDLILPLAGIPDAILGFARTEPRIVVPESDDEIEERTRRQLQTVFVKLRARTGRDFTHYKRSTILRRIARRMQFLQIVELATYVEFLSREADEARQLADDMLVNVTNFFRDREVFEILERDVVPQLFAGKGPDEPVRVWSVGCATGEESYSLAILLVEHVSRQPAPIQIQIFASDLHDRSLQRARDGFYPGDIETDVSAERLRRFFQKEDNGYRIRKELRELVVFAPHNLLTDPPFSRMDLISCRNVLIYLERNLQKDVT
ncbi:MAG: response regulator, partial [Planctomycetaceae bacterium]|nr:response regulator [Planctomycetaceae bacterium]